MSIKFIVNYGEWEKFFQPTDIADILKDDCIVICTCYKESGNLSCIKTRIMNTSWK